MSMISASVAGAAAWATVEADNSTATVKQTRKIVISA
jgi:hypothetical protein